MTNKKRTATAPIYTINSIIAKNSALLNKNSIDDLKIYLMDTVDYNL